MEPYATAAVLAVTGGLLVLAALVSRFSHRLGVPALLLFLLVGIAAGSEGIGGIAFADYALAFRVGSVALVLILFDGGLNTSPAVFRRAIMPAAALATVGVLVTALIVAGVAVGLGASWATAILVGAVVSSTDAAAVFSVLRGSRVRLTAATGATLEVESGLNDPLAMVLTIAATESLLGTARLTQALPHAAIELAIGAVMGVAVGIGARALLQRVTLPAAGLYPVVTVAFAFLAFGLTTVAGGSGLLAVYLAGLVLAAGPLPYRAGVRRVHDALAWLAQMAMFLMLGLLVLPSRLVPMIPRGIALAAALAFVARPVGVMTSLAPFRYPWRERAFIAWVGLRGAVPIILAAYPVLRGVPQGEQVFHLVFFVTLVNALVPGATVAWTARRLGLAQAVPPPPPATVELVSLRDYAGEFVWYRVAQVSAVAGARIHDLPLPDGSVLALLLRGDEVIAPRGDVELRAGDHVCAFVLPADRPFVDLLFGGGEGDR